MQISLPSAFLVLHILTSKCGTVAFVGSPSRRRRRIGAWTSSRSFSSSSTPPDVPDDSSHYFDAVRQQLEGLLTISAHPFRDEEDFPSRGWHSALLLDDDGSSFVSLEHDSTHAPPSKVEMELPPAPLLTTLERERRSMEIDFLKDLSEGEEAVANLQNLWLHERGSNAAARLCKTEAWIAKGQWEDAERELRALIREYGVYWVEPIHRLAKLMMLQKRFVQAETMLLIVLAVKPWHMGALSGMVMTYAALHDDPRAQEWAARRLPKLGGHRRSRWSRAAVQLAQGSLFDAEERLKDMFGARDTHHSILRCRGVFVPDDGIRFWQ